LQIYVKTTRKNLEPLRGINKVENNDFGHGIGFALHEYPTVENQDSKIGTNIIFTIEPTIQTQFGKMRIENMVSIDSKGSVKILTD
jgi:Xaa-Pro aminopeptidase